MLASEDRDILKFGGIFGLLIIHVLSAALDERE
jgi:hypothetical protein